MWFIYVIFFIGLLGIDLYSKKRIEEKQIDRNTKFFSIIYSENYGVALNILEGKKKLIIISNIFILMFIGSYTMYSIVTTSNYLKNLSLLLIIIGGLGNLINRLTKGYVIDFIKFHFKKSPIFNIADFYIIIGQFIVILLVFLGKF